MSDYFFRGMWWLGRFIKGTQLKFYFFEIPAPLGLLQLVSAWKPVQMGEFYHTLRDIGAIFRINRAPDTFLPKYW